MPKRVQEGVGLEEQRTQPSALSPTLCAQVLPNRMGIAGRSPGWPARMATAVTCSFRARGLLWNCLR